MNIERVVSLEWVSLVEAHLFELRLHGVTLGTLGNLPLRANAWWFVQYPTAFSRYAETVLPRLSQEDAMKAAEMLVLFGDRE